MVDPLDMETIAEFTVKTGLSILPCVTTPVEIQAAVHQHYHDGHAHEPQAESCSWWTILVVDDQELIRATILSTLKNSGYQTLEASNGANGLKMAYQHHPHLIVSDTLTPGMDGLEMFRALKATPHTSKIPMIALSLKSTPKEEARLLDAGYYDFIPKPLNLIRLLARVRKSLKTAYGTDRPPAR